MVNHKIKEYKTVKAHCVESLEECVNDFLYRGWYVYGNPAISITDTTVVYIQAMVKTYD